MNKTLGDAFSAFSLSQQWKFLAILWSLPSWGRKYAQQNGTTQSCGTTTHRSLSNRPVNRAHTKRWTTLFNSIMPRRRWRGQTWCLSQRTRMLIHVAHVVVGQHTKYTKSCARLFPIRHYGTHRKLKQKEEENGDGGRKKYISFLL